MRFGLELKNKDMYKGRCMGGTHLHRCTDMVGFIYVYLLCSPLLKFTHTNVDLGICSINRIVQSYLYTKAHAITQFVDKQIYTYMHTGRLLPTQMHKTSDVQATLSETVTVT